MTLTSLVICFEVFAVQFYIFVGPLASFAILVAGFTCLVEACVMLHAAFA